MNRRASNLLFKTVAIFATLVASEVTAAPIVISGYFANPSGGTDSPYEYVQFVATEYINFSLTPYSVVWANNGMATANGWVEGNALTYGFDLTTGTVKTGETFYVGGSGQSINGQGSTNISSLRWIRTINTLTTGGDGFGNASSDVLAQTGNHADGFAVFAGRTSTLTAATIPVDAIFYGTRVGTAEPPTGGYTMPTNDHYNHAYGAFGNGMNDWLFADPGANKFIRLTGTYDSMSDTWNTPRSAGSEVLLAVNSQAAEIESAITVMVPEPEADWLMSWAAVSLLFYCNSASRRLN